MNKENKEKNWVESISIKEIDDFWYIVVSGAHGDFCWDLEEDITIVLSDFTKIECSIDKDGIPSFIRGAKKSESTSYISSKVIDFYPNLIDWVVCGKKIWS